MKKWTLDRLHPFNFFNAVKRIVEFMDLEFTIMNNNFKQVYII